MNCRCQVLRKKLTCRAMRTLRRPQQEWSTPTAPSVCFPLSSPSGAPAAGCPALRKCRARPRGTRTPSHAWPARRLPWGGRRRRAGGRPGPKPDPGCRNRSLAAAQVRGEARSSLWTSINHLLELDLAARRRRPLSEGASVDGLLGGAHRQIGGHRGTMPRALSSWRPLPRRSLGAIRSSKCIFEGRDFSLSPCRATRTMPDCPSQLQLTVRRPAVVAVPVISVGTREPTATPVAIPSLVKVAVPVVVYKDVLRWSVGVKRLPFEPLHDVSSPAKHQATVKVECNRNGSIKQFKYQIRPSVL
jgi:hypothetical protein